MTLPAWKRAENHEKRQAIITHNAHAVQAWADVFKGPIMPKPTTPAQAKARANNGKKGGRPRTVPSPDALRESARILREHYKARAEATGTRFSTLGAFLEPVAVMLESMANGKRPPTPIPQRSPEVQSFMERHKALLQPTVRQQFADNPAFQAFLELEAGKEAAASVRLDKGEEGTISV